MGKKGAVNNAVKPQVSRVFLEVAAVGVDLRTRSFTEIGEGTMRGDGRGGFSQSFRLHRSEQSVGNRHRASRKGDTIRPRRQFRAESDFPCVL